MGFTFCNILTVLELPFYKMIWNIPRYVCICMCVYIYCVCVCVCVCIQCVCVYIYKLNVFYFFLTIDFYLWILSLHLRILTFFSPWNKKGNCDFLTTLPFFPQLWIYISQFLVNILQVWLEKSLNCEIKSAVAILIFYSVAETRFHINYINFDFICTFWTYLRSSGCYLEHGIWFVLVYGSLPVLECSISAADQGCISQKHC